MPACLFLGYNSAQHSVGTVTTNWTLTDADTAVNVCGVVTISLPNPPSFNQVISITNVCNQPVTVQEVVATTPPTGMGVDTPVVLNSGDSISVSYMLATQWVGTGVTMYSAKSPSAMKPYTLDSAGLHAPNVGIDVTATIDPYDTAADVVVLSELVPDSEAYPFALKLGWIGWGLNDSGNLGLIDDYLTELDATQIQEWANFSTIQAANLAALQAVPSYTAPTVQGATLYYSTAAAQTEIDILVAAGGGTGNSYEISNTDVGSFLSGAGTTAAGVITDAGTNFATYERTRTFLGGYDTRKISTRTYAIRSTAAVTANRALLYTLGTVTRDFLITIIGSDLVGSASNGIGYYYSLVNAADAIARAVAALPASFSFGGSSYTFYYTIPASGLTDVHYLRDGAYDDIVMRIFTDTSTVTPSYIDYADVTALDITANPTITLTSTLTASQESLNLPIVTAL